MQDQRLVNRLQDYWKRICRDKPLPDISQLNPAVIDELWQQCMQLGTHQAQGGFNYNYLFMGKRLVEVYGQDLTSQTVDIRASQYPLNLLLKKLSNVMESRSFFIDENQFINTTTGKMVKYRACFMPFGNETKGVTHIVIGFSGREF